MALKFGSKFILSLCAVTALAGCTNSFGLDVRDQFGGMLDTTNAAENAVAERPEPDARGVITFPSYQVVLARTGDRIGDVAARIGVDADRLGRFNGIPQEAILRYGEVIALPSNMTAVAADGAPLTPTVVDISELSDDPSAGPKPAEPKRHRVVDGETVYTISRLYSVSAEDLAKWNSLSLTTALRPGQYLLIPITQNRPTPVSAPGEGSITPTPPSSTRPQPRGELPSAEAMTTPTTADATAPVTVPVPVANTGPVTQASQSDARFMRPVSGTIIRSYKKGSNEGVDIGAPEGAAVSAADVGTVAAITEDTKGIAIVVIKHADGLLTVYTNVDNLLVKKGDAVTRGQEIAKVRAGTPSFLHFEVRKGLESVDPDDYI
ncbi:peptidoglycan DD-metalloendopeptidase family protein [Planktomarina temperata]|nr:peptidoglycan DD-metalloendopeptidase family protein [Planktomarina temperata]